MDQENISAKKPQKTGLGAIRPSEYIESQFREMAKENSLSQTEMFELICWSYIRTQNNEKQEQAISMESEIRLISENLNSILQHFKTIANKAQDTVISLKANAEQTEKNLTLEIDTRQKKLTELEKRNAELEQSNSVFTEIKTKIENELTAKGKQIDTLETTLKEKDRTLKDLDKEKHSLEKDVAKAQQQITELQETVTTKDIRIKNLETVNSGLTGTLSTLNELKGQEIAAIEARYKLQVTELQTKLTAFNEQKAQEMTAGENNLRVKLEAEKKIALADLTLKLANLQNEHTKVLGELNSYKK